MKRFTKTDYDAWLLSGSDEYGTLSAQDESWLEGYEDDPEGLEADLAQWLGEDSTRTEDEFYKGEPRELDGREYLAASPYERAQERYLERKRDEWNNYDPY